VNKLVPCALIWSRPNALEAGDYDYVYQLKRKGAKTYADNGIGDDLQVSKPDLQDVCTKWEICKAI